MSNSKSKILIQMTGSIACFKACALISKLVQAGHHVKVVASQSALKFVGEATIEGLTGEKVVHDLWQSGEAMAHIHLMRWADVIVVVPASANFINRISQGIGDDLLSTMFLAHDFKKPFLVAPAMNTSMYLHPVTQASIKRLRDMGIEILEAASGVLACGEVGYGRLLEPDLLQKEIEARLKSGATHSAQSPIQKGSSRKVLITAGGTQEPIDGVRVLTNLSTGKTGSQLTDHLESLGFSVVFVHAANSVQPQADVEKISFTSSKDLGLALQKRLAKDDIFAVIHLAAVSDFVVSEWEQAGKSHKASVDGKISSKEDLTLKLTKNGKILSDIRGFSKNALHLTAFKLTSSASADDQKAAVNRVFETSKPDWVVHNDTADMKNGQHPFYLYEKQNVTNVSSTADLAALFAQEFSKIRSSQKEENL